MDTIPPAIHEWQLQEAKNKFSQVVQYAIKDGPQIITLHGKQAVILLSIEQYIELTRPKGRLSEFFQQSPFVGVHLDLTRDKDLGRDVDL